MSRGWNTRNVASASGVLDEMEVSSDSKSVETNLGGEVDNENIESGGVETGQNENSQGNIETSGGGAENGNDGEPENVGESESNTESDIEMPTPPENETKEDLTDYLARLNEIYEALKAKEQELELNVIKQEIKIKKAEIQEIQAIYKQKQNSLKLLLEQSKVLSQEIELLKTLKPTLEIPQIQARIYLLTERLESLKGALV